MKDSLIYYGTMVGAALLITTLLVGIPLTIIEPEKVVAHENQNAGVERELQGIKAVLSRPPQVQCECRCPQ